MGQAKNRGTYDERKAEAIRVSKEREVERDRKEMEEQRIVAANWAKMSQEERDMHLKKAQAEMALLSFANQFQ